jgi:hypothetical protein
VTAPLPSSTLEMRSAGLPNFKPRLLLLPQLAGVRTTVIFPQFNYLTAGGTGKWTVDGTSINCERPH